MRGDNMAKIEQRVEYVQGALKADIVDNPERPLTEFSELVVLVGEQYDDDNNLTWEDYEQNI